MYRQLSFYTLNGIVKFIDLGDSVYGEWIIYDDMAPKYHVNLFDKNFNSNVIVNSLLENKKETIDSVIKKISTQQGVKLSMGVRPGIEILQKSEMIDLELAPLPESWLKNIIK